MTSLADERHQRLVQENLPDRLLLPWHEEAASEVPGWQATLFPLLGRPDSEAFYNLRRHSSVDGVGCTISFSGADKTALIARARDVPQDI